MKRWTVSFAGKKQVHNTRRADFRCQRWRLPKRGRKSLFLVQMLDQADICKQPEWKKKRGRGDGGGGGGVGSILFVCETQFDS